MIVPMLKYDFLIFYKDYSQFLKNIKELGVIHINVKKESSSQELTQLMHEYSETRQMIKMLSKRKKSENGEIIKLPQDAKELKIEIQNLLSRIDDLNHQWLAFEKEREEHEPWGIFDWAMILKLKEDNVQLSFYECHKQKFKDTWQEENQLEIVHQINNQIYFVIIHSVEKRVLIDADLVTLSEYSYHQIVNRQEECQQLLKEAEYQLDLLVENGFVLLLEYKLKLENEIQDVKVIESSSSEIEGKINHITSWVPENIEHRVNETLDQLSAYYTYTYPDHSDKPPICLKNKTFNRMFEPIGRLFSLPEYNELDLTPFFAPFFLLFFGFCLGDAGYGLIFILIALFFGRRINPEYRSILHLVMWLGFSTVLFGILTGTVFGISLIDSGYVLTESSIRLLNEILPQSLGSHLEPVVGVQFETKGAFLRAIENEIGEGGVEKYASIIIQHTDSNFKWLVKIRHLFLDPSKMFPLALILGGVQILFGLFLKVINVYKQKGIREIGAALGWFLCISTSVLFYGLDILIWREEHLFLGIIHLVILCISLLGIFIFNNLNRNIFINIGVGFWDAYGMITGMIGDLLSYIRLFALGLSSAILGLVFNQLAFNMSPDLPVIHELVIVVILLIGHGINLFMSGLGSFVHPLRLTFVEFYKNAGFIGGGHPYQPYKQN